MASHSEVLMPARRADSSKEGNCSAGPSHEDAEHLAPDLAGGLVESSGYESTCSYTHCSDKRALSSKSRAALIEFHCEYVLSTIGSKAMAGIGPNLSGQEHFGYTEPFRRFVQRESFEPQANAIPNEAPSWLPGDDYYTNFHIGDPVYKGRPGLCPPARRRLRSNPSRTRGYESGRLSGHEQVAILADVAPYSREYNTFRQKVGAQVRATPTGDRIREDPEPGQADP